MSTVDATDGGIGYAVRGFSLSGFGIWGLSNKYAVAGWSFKGYGVAAYSENSIGLSAYSRNSYGIYSESENGSGIAGSSLRSTGLQGLSTYDTGVECLSYAGVGLYASTENANNYAAILDGKVYIYGPLQKPGGSFKIDHPLDPANKYLYHSFVESSDMKNIYDGIVTLNENGEAWVDLPDWFGGLNKDFRYQLTAIGTSGPDLYIQEEISNEFERYNVEYNDKPCHFKIAGGKSAMKVSWQVTGIRKDPWANAHRIKVEVDKSERERGCYIYPELYDQPIDKGIIRLPNSSDINVSIDEHKKFKVKSSSIHGWKQHKEIDLQDVVNSRQYIEILKNLKD